MKDVQEFVDSFLEHSGSQYYDPVKAHEYYLKTRELKGRKPGQKLSDLKTTNQKEAWGYVKSKLSEDKQKELDAAAQAHADNLEKLRSTAEQRSLDIRDKFQIIGDKLAENRKATLEKLDAAGKAQVEKIAANTQKRIDSLPPIPDNVGKSRREALTRLRSREIARIRGEGKAAEADVLTKYSGDKTKVVEKSSDRNQALRDKAVTDSKKVGTDLKASVEKAREKYTSLKDTLKAKYEAKTQSEFDAIKTTVR